MTERPAAAVAPTAPSETQRCEPQVEDEAVIVSEVDAFLKAAGADLQSLHAAVTRFVVHCRERGEPIERIISTLKLIIAQAIYAKNETRAVDSINAHLLDWVLDAFYSHEY